MKLLQSEIFKLKAEQQGKMKWNLSGLPWYLLWCPGRDASRDNAPASARSEHKAECCFLELLSVQSSLLPFRRVILALQQTLCSHWSLLRQKPRHVPRSAQRINA